MPDTNLLYVMKTDEGYDFFSAVAEVDQATWDAALLSVDIPADAQADFDYRIVDDVHVWSFYLEAK